MAAVETQAPSASAAGDPGQLARHAHSHPRRQPLLLPRGHRLLPGERSRFHPRRCADHDPAPPCRSARGGRQSRFEAGAKKAKVRSFKEFYDGTEVGAASNVLLPASKRAKTEPTQGSSSPISPAAGQRSFTRTSIAGAAALKIISNPGKPISPPIEPHAARRPPTSSACSCMPGPTGCSGPCAPPCQSARPGGSRSSIRCAFTG